MQQVFEILLNAINSRSKLSDRSSYFDFLCFSVSHLAILSILFNYCMRKTNGWTDRRVGGLVGK